MQDQEIFNGLIATYRDLNLRVRPLPDERLRLGQGRSTVKHVISDMRDDELRFSQALKDRLGGAPMDKVLRDLDDTGGGDELVVPGPDDTVAEVLSQFGTARESTLAMLRGMTPDEWDAPGEGGLTIRQASERLVGNDARHMEKIVRLLGSPAA
ncbi:MAG: hypothetical protein R2853_01560 [Thermomicrobiales bacterium]|nr:hypothetical protein [Thermomicrobiales bacterium]